MMCTSLVEYYIMPVKNAIGRTDTKKSYGLRTEEAVKTALYHRLGALPEPEFAHRFW
jgi:hypothetical protein